MCVVSLNITQNGLETRLTDVIYNRMPTGYSVRAFRHTYIFLTNKIAQQMCFYETKSGKDLTKHLHEGIPALADVK